MASSTQFGHIGVFIPILLPMNYYEVYIASQRFHGSDPLTYASQEPLQVGTVVSIPMQRQTILGIIGSSVTKPSFNTKEITAVVADPLPPQSIELLKWLQSYYPAPLGFLTQLFLPQTLLQKSRVKPTEQTVAQKPKKLPSLTDEQSAVIKEVNNSSQSSFLLHGDTGSGKTRVYLELVKEGLASDKSSIVLTPEIGLTPQLVADFEATFPGQVVTVHSTLTPAERRNAWQRINQTTSPIVIIGPRSALFSPVHKLGYIIIDEVHDSAYKQEQAPYYQASRVAATLASLHGAKLILGSATPLVSDYQVFNAKKLPILRMTKSAIASEYTTPTVHIVDLSKRDQFPRSSWLSSTALEAVSTALNEGSQSLVFLNRRGTARLVICQNCGWQATCPRCDLPLTYHGDTHQLRCHTCGHHETAPAECPTCHSTDIVFKSVGTKTLVDELQRIFPKARVQRFDSDTIKADRLEQHYESIKAGDVDILVGTQMLSKGLDLPRLSAVIVVVADTSLYFPDYTANERTYQLLTQVMGRVGRGHREKSTIVIQTYHPDSPTIAFAAGKDFQSFYKQELLEREQFHFPPYYFVLKLGTSRASQSSASTSASKLHELLQSSGLAIDVSSPMPAFTEKVNGRYRWQLVVKAKQRSELTKLIALLPSGWSYDLDPSHLL